MPVLSLERDSAFAGPGRENVRNYPGGASFNRHDVNRAHTTIDRGIMGKTWIQRGVKIENLVQIATINGDWRICLIVAQVGISGSTKLGKGVILGGQPGLVDTSINRRYFMGALSRCFMMMSPPTGVSGPSYASSRSGSRPGCVPNFPICAKHARLHKTVENLKWISLEYSSPSGVVSIAEAHLKKRWSVSPHRWGCDRRKTRYRNRT